MEVSSIFFHSHSTWRLKVEGEKIKITFEPKLFSVHRSLIKCSSQNELDLSAQENFVKINSTVAVDSLESFWNIFSTHSALMKRFFFVFSFSWKFQFSELSRVSSDFGCLRVRVCVAIVFNFQQVFEILNFNCMKSIWLVSESLIHHHNLPNFPSN